MASHMDPENHKNLKVLKKITKSQGKPHPETGRLKYPTPSRISGEAIAAHHHGILIYGFYETNWRVMQPLIRERGVTVDVIRSGFDEGSTWWERIRIND